MKKLSRRTVLRGAAGAVVGLPFLEAMLPRNRSVAQTGTIPKRVVFFYTPCGIVPETWWPNGAGPEYRLNEAMTPLEPFRDKLAIPDGIKMHTATEDRVAQNGHDLGTAHCLTARNCVAGPTGVGEFGHLWDGTAGGISIDQHIAQHFATHDPTPYSSLEFGVKAEGIRQALPSRISYLGQGMPVIPMNSAGQAYDRILAPLAGDSEDTVARHRRRMLVLDSVGADLNRLRPRLGADDKRRIDAHLASLESVQRQLNDLASAACTVPPREDSDNFDALGRFQMDLIVQALKCDLTRVCSIQWSTGQSNIRHTWLGHMDSHHSISHKNRTESPDWARSQFYVQVATAIDHWYATQYAYLLGQLDAIDAGDGTSLLDNTVVVWVNEQQRGIGNNHRWQRMPFVLGGSCGGYFTSGSVAVDAGHGDLYVTLMQALGMPDMQFGIPEYSLGPISTLIA